MLWAKEEGVMEADGGEGKMDCLHILEKSINESKNKTRHAYQ